MDCILVCVNLSNVTRTGLPIPNADSDLIAICWNQKFILQILIPKMESSVTDISGSVIYNISFQIPLRAIKAQQSTYM